MTIEEKQAFLKQRGWYQWYNDNYWCHEQFGENGRDPTSYGMSLQEAYKFETDPKIRKEIMLGMSLASAVRKLFGDLS